MNTLYSSIILLDYDTTVVSVENVTGLWATVAGGDSTNAIE